jgi:hypothetical protein
MAACKPAKSSQIHVAALVGLPSGSPLSAIQPENAWVAGS